MTAVVVGAIVALAIPFLYLLVNAAVGIAHGVYLGLRDALTYWRAS